MSAKLKEFGSINSFEESTAFLSDNEKNCDFKNYIISISGFGELICFGFGKFLVLASMNCSYNSSTVSNGFSFNICSQENICIDSECITSILVLPISSLKQSSQGLPDWTCICVGLSSGTVKFFDQFGQMIHSQKFHTSSIESICLRASPRHNQSDLFSEDLMILCDNCCFQIEGLYLYESLNTSKKQLIRFQAGFIDDQWDSFEFCFKKWLLDPHDIVTGIIFGYETSDTIMDNIFNNVVDKGPFLAISEDAAKHINCAVVGKEPFVAFYKIPLESDSLDMGDMAHAVFSKVKGVLSTSISSWMGSYYPSANTKKPIQKSVTKKPDSVVSELPSRLQKRHSIEEPTRQATMIVGCPHHNKQARLAAMTDDFGRIFLLDIDDGIVLRMWKGYRDAQISISSTSDGSTTERSVNYLTIYAPRRSLIEVWTLPFGEKVASFDVRDRNGRLLHVPNASLGFSRIQMFNQKVKNVYSTFFLDSNGKISVFDIPFHLSLSSSSSERCQDHLVLKHFKTVIRNEITKTDPNAIKTEFSSSIRLLKLPCSIELLMNNVLYLTHLPCDEIVSFIDELLDLLSSSTTTLSPQEADTRRLRSRWAGIKSLIQCYTKLTNTQTMVKQTNTPQNLEYWLKLGLSDCDRIMGLLRDYCRYNKPVDRPSNSSTTYLLFVNNFTMLPNSSDEEVDGFQLSTNALEKDVHKIGTVLFSQYVFEDIPIEDLIDPLLHQRKIDQPSCFRLCLSFLINENPSSLMDNIGRVKDLLSRILSPVVGVSSDQLYQYRLIKSSLQLSYEMIEKSSNLMTSLLIAMIIRVIILDFLQNDAMEKEEVRLGLTNYLQSWDDICKRLEDLTIFDCFLKCRPLSDRNDKSKKVNVSFDRELVLYLVLESGKGIFSERFAKWALKWNLKFNHINELYKSLGKNDNKDQITEESLLSEEVKEIFAVLYKQLPHSLEYDSVLINVAWEYTRLWSKSIQRVEYLENACQLLESIGPAGGLVIQGIGSMIWDMHIVIGLSTLFPVDKTGGQQYSSQLAGDISNYVVRFLNMLIKALDNVDVIPTFSTEVIWRGDKSRSSLIDMAVNKEPIIESTLELHIQLLYALQLISMLNMVTFNGHSLFSKETRLHIFKSLTATNVSDSLISDTTDCKLHRIRFLEKCIKSCVKIFNESTDNNNLCHRTNTIIKLLAEKWTIDLDHILQCWIQNYYQLGLDSQGSMYLDKVVNMPLLGISLLKIVGSRIKKEYLLPDSNYKRECSKYVAPTLRRWFQTLDEKVLKETVITSLDKSEILLDQVLEWVPENCFDFEAATCLQSLIVKIQGTMKYIE